MAKVVGLTGGIATGKSHVSTYLNEHGITVIDADQITRRLEEPGESAFDQIIRQFGTDNLTQTGQLDRRKLSKLVFANPMMLKKLVRLVNPFLQQRVNEELFIHRDERLVIFDAPTLFENGFHYLVDSVVVVYCNPAEQMRRLIDRDDLTVDEAKNKINSQWPLVIKCQLGDTIFDNSDAFSKTTEQIDQWLDNELI